MGQAFRAQNSTKFAAHQVNERHSGVLESFPLRSGCSRKPSAPEASTVVKSPRFVHFNGISLGTNAQQLSEAAIADKDRGRLPVQ